MSIEDRILDGALTCLRESGGLTMAQVAEKAHISRQAVYLHFPGRDALLAALRARFPVAPDIGAAPSARAALALLVSARANADPALAALDETPDTAEDRLTRCRTVALRFQAEGALAPQLSPAAAADLLWSLTGPRLWDALTAGRNWGADRARIHVTYLATSAVTK